ncbi:hypothetical protein QW131_27420 [Roseibium salinum]|nr:hypothetical protein [Roseibium salinum]
MPENAVQHGEKPFKELVPFIRHADFGVAPYKMRKEDVYLAETSLKFLQYAYCRLPVVTPDLIPNTRGNLVGYSVMDEKDWRGTIAAALSLPKSDDYSAGIFGWDEVSARIVECLQSLAKKTNRTARKTSPEIA